MTPTELRALADALEPMARAPRFEDFDVPAFCAWLRAQAEAEPVAWIVEHGPTRRLTFFDEAPGKVGTGVSIPLYTHPAPAAPQAEPSAALIRAYNSGYMQGHHDTVESCFTDIHQSDMDTFHADLVAELGLSAAPQAEPIDPHMIVADDRFPDEQAEPKREPLSDERIAEIQRAAYERAAQECIETAAELRRCADGCTDGRYDWKADGAADCADAISALGRQQ